MDVLPMPQGVIDKLDQNRRGFFWTGTAKASGAQCLVAWERVCDPKAAGGLGFKQLATQNQCLLLKLLHRLHHPGDSSWAAWARANVSLVDLTGDVEGAH